MQNAIASLRETRSAEELLAALSAIRPESGGTLLHVCSIAGHSDVIRALLNIGVDASVVATAGVYMGKSAYQTADPAVLPAFHVYLFEKIALGHDKVIENLLDGGISVDLRDASAIDDSTLHWACSFGNVSVALILLDRGCPVNILNSSGQTPLHLACKNGSREVIELLLSRGANALLVDTHGRVAAQMVPEKHKDVLELISASVSEHPLQHTIHLPQQEETDEMVSANIEPDLYSERSAQGAHTMDDEGPPASAPYLRPSLANVTSHLILWPPPQRQRMLPMGSAEGDNDTSCALTPEFGIVFSNFRPILISCCTEDKSGTDISCIAELCGLTQALRRFGLESVVLRSPATADVRFSVNSSLCAGHNRYSINVCPSFISVIGSDNEGLLYGAHTLVQIVQLHSEFGIIEAESAVKDPSRDDLEFDLNGFSVSEAIKHADVIRTLTVPCVCVEDWPDFPSRGITWSYDSAALTNTSVLHNLIAMLSRMRMNKLFLHVDCLDYSSTAQQTEMAFTARQRDNVLCGSRIHYIERLCRSYFIDVVPKVSVPCLDIEPSGSSHKR